MPPSEPSDDPQTPPSSPTPRTRADKSSGLFGGTSHKVFFLAALLLVVISTVTDHLPSLLISGFTITALLGGLFMWLGTKVPVLRDFGLPTILCTFLPATLVYFGFFPGSVPEIVARFADDLGFVDFFIVALVAGSILGMPRAMLVKVGPRFLLPLLTCIVTAMFGTAALGAISGYGFRETLFYISAPALGGGIGIGAIPMSDMYAEQFGGSAGDYLPSLMSAVVLANVLCILIAGLYNGMIGRRRLFVGFNGEGRLLRTRDENAIQRRPKNVKADFTALGKGLLIACVLFVAGNLISAVVPAVHAYAWMILLAALLKIFSWLPEDLERASSAWGDMVSQIWLPALLVCVSFAYIDMADVIDAVSDPVFSMLVACCVVLSAGTAGLLGWLVRMYFVESSITPGLAMADSGGSGDVAVLSAADRLTLMPFAQLSTRLGGMVTLSLISILVSVIPPS